MIKTVLFDLDDTLYDEIDYCRSGFRAVAGYLAGKYSISADKAFEIMWGEFTGGNRERVFNKVLDGMEIAYDGEIIHLLVGTYRNHKPSLMLPDESREVLERLSGKYKLGLVSDGYLPAQRYKLDELDIEKYFEVIVFTEEIGREFWKPSTRGFEIACEKISNSYEQSVYVADNITKDFAGPNKLGFAAAIQLIRANKVHKYEAPNEIAKPSHVVKNLYDVEKIIESL